MRRSKQWKMASRFLKQCTRDLNLIGSLTCIVFFQCLVLFSLQLADQYIEKCQEEHHIFQLQDHGSLLSGKSLEGLNIRYYL